MDSTRPAPLQVALLGATGGVGGHFLERALEAGHQIRVLVRDPSRLPSVQGLTAIKGDATNRDDIDALVAGAGVIVSCLGNPKGMLIMEGAADAILEAAARQPGPPKCLFVTSIGCGGSSWVIKQVLSLIGGRQGFADYDRADARIRAETTVPWVLVRPAALTDKQGTGRYRVFRSSGTFARPIPRADVAKFLFDAMTCDDWDGQGGVQLAGSN